MFDDEETLCKFGTPLPQYAEDEIPSKKAFDITDQIAVDANGRRRFHGAFTGGFSAGYWNTVGSHEGWKPQEFKSSRSQKAEQLKQTPNDFMDDEDLGEFGIAPSRIQTTDDFTPQSEQIGNDKKRKAAVIGGGTAPIPGVPVLHMLLESRHEKIAIRLLKRMGWKDNQGVGARLTKKQKQKATNRYGREHANIGKLYQCDMGPFQKRITMETGNQSNDGDDDDHDHDHDDNTNSINVNESDTDGDNDSDDEITFAPDDFESILLNIKDNRFGLGYEPLSRQPILSQQTTISNVLKSFEVVDKHNKKLSIRGQAFGVGAFEEDDDDIYARDNIALYDFSLGGSQSNKKPQLDKQSGSSKNIIEGFCPAEIKQKLQNKVFRIDLPATFVPRNWLKRKSRFAPPAAILDDPHHQQQGTQDKINDGKNHQQQNNLGRHYLTPAARGDLLNDSIDKQFERPTTALVLNKTIDFAASSNDEPSNSNNKIKIIDATKRSQENILNYIKLEEKNNDKVLIKTGTDIEESNHNSTEKDSTIKYRKPKIPDNLIELFTDRFISEKDLAEQKAAMILLKTDDDIKIEPEPEQDTGNQKPKIIVKKYKIPWQPVALLCQRMNIADPLRMGIVQEEKKKKISIFDSISFTVETNIPPPSSTAVLQLKPPSSTDKSRSNLESQSSQKQQQHQQQPPSNASNVAIIPSDEIKIEKIYNPKEDPKIIIQKSTASNTIEMNSGQKKNNTIKKTDFELKIINAQNKHPSEKRDIFKAIFEDSDDDDNDEHKQDDNTVDGNNIERDSTNQPLIADSITKTLLTNLPKSAADINILRNTSPPRGIFANLISKKITGETNELQNDVPTTIKPEVEQNSMKLKKSLIDDETNKTTPIKIQFRSKQMRNNNINNDDDDYIDANHHNKHVIDVTNESDSMYGPKLPDKIIKPTVINEKICDIPLAGSSTNNNNNKYSKSSEKWIEKSVDVDDGKYKNKKKHKEKKKHKKEKHKSKKHKKK